jgi:hypothetical protein
MEGGGGVTFLSCLSRSPYQPESKQNLFLIYRITRRFHLENHFKSSEGNKSPT